MFQRTVFGPRQSTDNHVKEVFESFNILLILSWNQPNSVHIIIGHVQTALLYRITTVMSIANRIKPKNLLLSYFCLERT